MTPSELPELIYIEYCEKHNVRWDLCECNIQDIKYYACGKSVHAREQAIVKRLRDIDQDIHNYAQVIPLDVLNMLPTLATPHLKIKELIEELRAYRRTGEGEVNE